MLDGTLIVADKYTHSVNIVAVDGELLQVIGEGQAAKGPGKFTTPEGVELKGDILWIADSGNDRIVEYRMNRRSKDPHTHGRYRIFLCGALGLRLYLLEASVGSGRRRARTDRPPALRLARCPGGERPESDQRADAATPSVFLRLRDRTLGRSARA